MNEITWSPGVKLEQVEKQVIEKAFRFYGGNKTATAVSLGISVRTLDNKLEKYNANLEAEKEKELERKNINNLHLQRARGAIA